MKKILLFSRHDTVDPGLLAMLETLFPVCDVGIAETGPEQSVSTSTGFSLVSGGAAPWDALPEEAVNRIGGWSEKPLEG